MFFVYAAVRMAFKGEVPATAQDVVQPGQRRRLNYGCICAVSSSTSGARRNSGAAAIGTGILRIFSRKHRHGRGSNCADGTKERAAGLVRFLLLVIPLLPLGGLCRMADHCPESRLR